MVSAVQKFSEFQASTSKSFCDNANQRTFRLAPMTALIIAILSTCIYFNLNAIIGL